MAIRLPTDPRAAMVTTMVFSGLIGAIAGAIAGSCAAFTMYSRQFEKLARSSVVESVAAQKEANDVARYGRVIRPWLGVQYSTIDPVTAKEKKLPVTQGAWVDPQEGSVFTESPADKAGLKPGDIIVAVDDASLVLPVTLSDVIAGYRPGDTVTLHVLRAGKQLVLEATLRDLPQTSPN